MFCSIEQEEDCGTNNGEKKCHHELKCVCMHVCGLLKYFVVDSKLKLKRELLRLCVHV